MISVVAPNLNEAPHLPTFLNSLTQQTYKDFETIIIDGGSTDGSLQIIKKYRRQLNPLVGYCPRRNFGFIRNLGHKLAKGKIIFQCNTDNYFPPHLLKTVRDTYAHEPRLIALTGRVYPMGTSWIAKLAYPAFDLLRWFFSRWKFRPSGSFLTYRRWAWKRIGGFPEVTVNEDGLFGQRLDALGFPVKHDLNLWIGHHVKKFENMGGLKALTFYLYVLGNHFPILRKPLKPFENKAGNVFSGRENV